MTPITKPYLVLTRTDWAWLVALLLMSVALRVALLGSYPAQAFPDTPTYIDAARDLVSGDYSVGQGRRTPGYPSLIVAAGFSTERLVLLQQAAGVLTSVLMFLMARALTGSSVWGFAAGLVHSINLQQLYAENALIAESHSAFAVALATAACLVALHLLRRGQSACTWSLVTGLLAAYALLVRPQFIFFIGLFPLLALLAGALAKQWRKGVTAAACLVVPMLLAVLGWCAVVQSKVGPFTVSTQSGFGLLNHLYEHLEHAPAEFALVRDIMIRTRDSRLAAVGNSRNTVWYSWDEVKQTTGWSIPEASQNYQKMAVAIIKAQPVAYARSVASAWKDFWSVPNLWEPTLIRSSWLRNAMENIWWLEHKLLRGMNLAFVLAVLAVTISGRVRTRLGWDFPISALTAVVLASSVLQAIADTGTNSRYAMPTQSMVVLVLLVTYQRWRARLRHDR